MKRKNYLFCLILFIFSNAGLIAQDIHFSQASETPLYLSPANTGFFNGYVRAIGNYRNQWAAMNNAFQTYAISVDGGLFRSKKRSAFMGLGLTVFRDMAGAGQLSKTTALLNASAILKVSKGSVFSAGFAFGSSGTSANYSKLTYESQYNGNTVDPNAASGEIPYRQYTTLDMGTGLAYEVSKTNYDQDHNDVSSLKMSIGAFHLNKPVQEYGAGSTYRLPVKMVYSILSNIDIVDTRFSITPTFVYQTQGKNQNMLIGSDLKFRMSTGTKVTGEKTQNALGFGVYYRRKDAVVVRLIAELGDYAIGISNDFNVSGYRAASNVSGGGFEVSLRYNMLAGALFDSKREYR